MAAAKKKVIIIEDEKSMAEALRIKFSHAGFDASAVFNGKEGIDLIEKEKFSLILLDLVMPVMNGFEVLEALQKKNSKIPVIILSNLSQEEDEKHAKALGAKEFYIKSNTPIATIIENAKKLLK